MIKRIGDEYYKVKATTWHEVSFNEIVKFSDLQVGEMITNIMHMYSRMILVPYRHTNLFDLDIFKVMLECHGLEIDYFEFIMRTMDLKRIEELDAHIGLIKMWIKLR